MKKKLTLQMLKDMEPETIFATGVVIDNPSGINMTNSDEKLRWVACRGGIHDWAIYIHIAGYDEDWVKRHGDKVHSYEHIKKLVPCDDEAIEMYRH